MRVDRPRYMRVAPMSSEQAVDELRARLNSPDPTANLREIVLAIHAARLGRHGHLPTGAVIKSAAAFRRNNDEVTR